MSEQALARKARSEAILAAEGVPFITHLPVIEDELGAMQRTKEEVGGRAMALCLVAVKGEGLEQEDVLDLLEQYDLDGDLSPKESDFVYDGIPSEQDRCDFSWRYEAYWVLLWALQYVDDLGRPDHICDVPKAVETLSSRTREAFIRQGRLRPLSEFLDQADLIYRYHWAVVDARLKGEDPPAGLDPGVVYERHYALNWLIGYMDEEWDEISTHT